MKIIVLFLFVFLLSNLCDAQKNNSLACQFPFQFIDYYENRTLIGAHLSYYRLFKEHLNTGIGLGYARELGSQNKVMNINAMITARLTAQYFLMSELKRFFFQAEIGYSAVNENLNVVTTNLTFGSRMNIGLGLGYAIPIKNWRILIDANTGTYLNLVDKRPGALFNRISLGGVYVF